MKLIEIIYDSPNNVLIERTMAEFPNPNAYKINDGYIELLNYKNGKNVVGGTSIAHIVHLPKDRLFYVKF